MAVCCCLEGTGCVIAWHLPTSCLVLGTTWKCQLSHVEIMHFVSYFPICNPFYLIFHRMFFMPAGTFLFMQGCLGQATSMNEKGQEHRLPLRPVLQHILLWERVVMLVESLGRTLVSLGHLQSEQRGELILGRRAVCLVNKAQVTDVPVLQS